MSNKSRVRAMNTHPDFSFSEDGSIATIFGVTYATDLFRHLGIAPIGSRIEIVAREDGVITLRQLPIDSAAEVTSPPIKPPMCVQALMEALRVSQRALDDWMHTYAPEMCDDAKVKESRERVAMYGTLAYIALVQKGNRAALAAAPPEVDEELLSIARRWVDELQAADVSGWSVGQQMLLVIEAWAAKYWSHPGPTVTGFVCRCGARILYGRAHLNCPAESISE